jgi:hypothetical protein
VSQLRTARRGIPVSLAIVAAALLSIRVGHAKGQQASNHLRIDPGMITYQLPDQIHWTGDPAVVQQAVLVGDPSRPGLYAILIKWMPHHMSRPHFHPHDRYVTVISGTWWVASGTTYDPNATVPMPAGSFVTDLAGQPHYDGAKDEPAIIEIVGEGPATSTPAEKTPAPER